MTFRELLDKYRAGQASEEERALVEAELEKSEAIADYLAEQVEDALGAMLLMGAPRMVKPTKPGSRSSSLRTPAHRKVNPSFQLYRSSSAKSSSGLRSLGK